jgi:hypothetical protein
VENGRNLKAPDCEDCEEDEERQDGVEKGLEEVEVEGGHGKLVIVLPRRRFACSC